MISSTSFCLDEITDLLADCLDSSPSMVQPLAVMISEKTGGNCLLVHQFLQGLNEKYLIHFSDNNYFVIDASQQLKFSGKIGHLLLKENQLKFFPKNVFQIILSQLIINYLWENYSQALEKAELAKDYLGSKIDFWETLNFYFYDALNLLKLVKNADKIQRAKWLNRINKNYVKIQKLYHKSFGKYQYKLDLIQAEKCRTLGKILRAEDAYELAITGATEQQHLAGIALSYELAAQFYLDRGRLKIAQTYFQSAYDAYQNWGALAKLKQLKNCYPNLVFIKDFPRELQASLSADLTTVNQTLELQIMELKKELVIAQQKAEVASQAKDSFLANMSHELRSPLNAILGFSQLIVNQSNLTPADQERLQIIQRNGEHLLDLINNILKISQIEFGTLTLEETVLDLPNFLEKIQTKFIRKAQEKQLKFTISLTPNIPLLIHIDAVKLEQILWHLLRNAFKFTILGSITLHVKYDQPDQLTFTVTDTGCGISAPELEHIFLPFHQGKQTRHQQDIGLGLAISAYFVELMGGKLQVESQPQIGSRFWFEIRCRVIENLENSTPVVISSMPEGHLSPQNYRVLIVDDQSDNRELLLELLEPLQLQCREVYNGQEALEVWETWHPHLILMDMQMPILDGYTATKMIRQKEAKLQNSGSSWQTQIIAVTASVWQTEQVSTREAGCDDFLAKPFTESQLYAIINDCIKKIPFNYPEDIPPERIFPELNPAKVRDSLGALPSSVRQTLEKALISLDSEFIQESLKQVGAYNPDLMRVLQGLVHDFHHATILDLMQASTSTFI